MRVVDLFAGPGGWDVAAARLGFRPVGVEVDRWACATRAAAGHVTVRADVETVRVPALSGLIASPPCQAFSSAGKGEGREHTSALVAAATAGETRPDLPAGVRLVLEPIRWISTARPGWVAMEQVPAVLPVWQGYARWLATLGYSVWCGVLNTADYGVPQTRQRAILLASQGSGVSAPLATHDRTPAPTLFGPALKPWVTMADALGWEGEVWTNSDNNTDDRAYTRPTSQPAPTLTERGQRWWVLDRRQTGAPTLDPLRVPSPTVTGAAFGKGVWTVTDGAGDPVKVSLAEVLTIQTFCRDYPVRGPRSAQFLQIGNAVPPLFAERVLAAVTGSSAEVAA